MDAATLVTAADWTGLVAAVGIAVSLVMQLVKPLVETIPAFDPANARAYRDEAHNAILRILTGALTYGGVLLLAVQTQPLTSQLAVVVLGLAFPGSGAAFLSFKSGQKVAAKLSAPGAAVIPPPPAVPPLPSDANPVPSAAAAAAAAPAASAL